ncbi:hypothetical protein [Streptomyces sp. NPDC091371]|uniref:hypothetical protein n=1 Tax=Streptomyces sp. NPDC091371 TaxID=3155303 RepID=UPI00344442CC
MRDNVKFLPPAAIPEEGAGDWAVGDAREWWAARTPGFFSPAVGGWVLAPLVVAGSILVGWNEPEEVGRVGTDWAGYWAAILLFCLPLWFRFLPAAAMVSTAVVAVTAGISLPPASEAGDTAGLVGAWLILGCCAYAFTGALWRLASRSRQRELALAAAGKTRVPLPSKLPSAHRRRGLRLMLIGGGLCLAAVALLAWGLVQDRGAQGGEAPYDAVGQQVLALLPLIPGTPLLGRGLTAQLAARRLRTRPQPVLRVGVRARYSGRMWLYPDARTTDAPALIAFRDRGGNTEERTRTLVGGTEARLRSEHHDIDPKAEPFEALLYGLPFEGAEIVLEYAAITAATIDADVMAVQLVPERRDRPGSWWPRETSYRVKEREREARRREEWAARSSDSGSGSGSGSSSGCGSSSSCGSSCSSSCGGGGGCS